MKEMDLDRDTKDMLMKISALSSIKADVIRQVWEFTAAAWYLQIADNPEKMSSINIPYFGKIGVRFKNEKLKEDGNIQSEIDAFAVPSDNFANMVGDIYNQARAPIVEFIQNELLKNAINNCEEK